MRVMTNSHVLRCLATAAAAIGIAGVAATSASAAPIDTFQLSSLGGTTHFGTNCTNVGPPVTDAMIDWKLDAAGDYTPQLTGDICLQTPSNNVQTQVILEYRNANDIPVATRPGRIQTGSGGLNRFGVTRGGITLSSVGANHVHVLLLDDRANPGTLAVVRSTAEARDPNVAVGLAGLLLGRGRSLSTPWPSPCAPPFRRRTRRCRAPCPRGARRRRTRSALTCRPRCRPVAPSTA